MKEELFADAIGDIKFENGVFRIDLVSLSRKTRDKDKKALLEFRQRVIMPPDGFLRSFSSMERIVKKMFEAGIVKRADLNKVETESLEDKKIPPSFS